MGTLIAGDAISGREGSAYATIDGRNVELFMVKTFEASIELTKKELPVLGRRMNQQKVSGANGTGSMNIYSVTSEFTNIAINYLRTGKLPVITMKVTNDDPNSRVGRRTVLLKDIVMDKVTISKLDIEAEALDEDIDFTFSDAETLESQVVPPLG